MRLDEIKWSTGGYYDHAPNFNGRKIELLRANCVTCHASGRSINVGNYYISAGGRTWVDLDPLTAQAILYHLLTPEGNDHEIS